MVAPERACAGDHHAHRGFARYRAASFPVSEPSTAFRQRP
jgi:hypothetical protein